MAESRKHELDQLNRFLSQEIVEPAREAQKEWLELSRTAINYIYSNQLGHMKIRSGWDRVQANYLWPAMAQEVAILSGRRPVLQVTPWESSDTEGAALRQSHYRWLWEKHFHMRRLLMDAAWDNKLFGFCVAKVLWEHKYEWDAEQKRWVGMPLVNIVHPAYFGADPEAESFAEARSAFSCRRVQTAWAQRRWPAFKDQIAAAAREQMDQPPMWEGTDTTAPYEDDEDDERDLAVYKEGRLANLIMRARRERGGQREERTGQYSPRYVTLEEIYWSDYRERRVQDQVRIPVEELLETGQIEDRNGVLLLGGEPVTEDNWPTRPGASRDEPVFPRGRMVLRVGDTILNPTERDQAYPYRCWPFAVGVNGVLPHVWQGLNGVELGRPLQDWVNTSLQHMGNWLRNFCDPALKVEEGAVLGAEDGQDVTRFIRNEAGAIWKLHPQRMAGVQREQGVPAAAGLFNVYEVLTREVQNQTGIHDVSTGRQLRGAPTATEAATLDANAHRRVSVQAQLMDEFTLAVWQRVSELCDRHYEPGRMLRVVGAQNAAGVVRMEQEQFDARYDLHLEVTTALPFDRERMKQHYLELYSLGVVAILPELLQAMEVPNPEEILARHDAWQQFTAFQQQSQEMQEQLEGMAEE